MNWSRPREKSLWRSTLLLIGHVTATAVVFVAVIALGWLVSFLISYLDSQHKFPSELFSLVTKLEVWVVYIDIGVSAVVLIAGLWRFVWDVVMEDR